jgi:putative ABC transport system permease protein
MIRQMRQSWTTAPPTMSLIPMRGQLDILGRDLRYALRLLGRFPQLTAAVLVTLVVGVGVNSTVFSIFNGLLFRANVSRDPATFVQIYATPSGGSLRQVHGTPYMLTLEEYDLIRRTTRSLAAVTVSQWTFLGLEGAERSDFRGKYVSCNYLSAHSGPLLHGRGFAEDDCAAPGGQAVMVLTERGWTLRFGRDPNVIGRTVRLNGQPVVIIGIAPDDPAGDPVASLYFLPYTMKSVIDPAQPVFRDPPGKHAWLTVSGRLVRGQTIRDVQRELDGLAQSLTKLHAAGTMHFLVTNGALISEPGTARRIPILIAICMGSAALILLMICGTVTTLLLARAAGRRHEMAVRLSLGASRGRLLRQLLTESLVLALTAGVVSLALAYYLPDRIARMLTSWPMAVSLGPDWRVLGYTLGVSLLAGCVAGLSPALESLRFQLIDTLKPQGQGDGRPSNTFLRGLLIADQLAISLALLVAMGLVMRAQGRLSSFEPGYDPNATMALSLDLARFNYTPVAARQFGDRLLPRVAAMPGVKAVSVSHPLPFRGQPCLVIRSDGPVGNLSAAFRIVSPAYFQMMNIRLTQGRLFGDDDGWQRRLGMPVVVSESFVRAVWPGLNPLGRRVMLADGNPAEVVGVVSDTSSLRPGEADEPLLYQPPASPKASELSVLVRFSGDARPLTDALRREVRALDSQLLAAPETIASVIAQEAAHYNAVVTLTAVPSGLAVFLALIGVYGVTSFAAVQRRHEVGIRIALGARPHEIVTLLFRSLQWPVLAGLAIGIPLSLLSARLLQRANLLLDLDPLDPWAFAFALTLVVTAAAVATLIPALRVASADPSRVLRRS